MSVRLKYPQLTIWLVCTAQHLNCISIRGIIYFIGTIVQLTSQKQKLAESSKFNFNCLLYHMWLYHLKVFSVKNFAERSRCLNSDFVIVIYVGKNGVCEGRDVTRSDDDSHVWLGIYTLIFGSDKNVTCSSVAVGWLVIYHSCTSSIGR